MEPLSELRRAVQGLAQPASTQQALFPDFACVGDELAIELENALLWLRGAGVTLTPDQERALDALDRCLDDLSGPANEAFWVEPSALALDPRWETIRTLARDVLSNFEWSNETPPLNGAVYVTSDKAVTNTPESAPQAPPTTDPR